MTDRDALEALSSQELHDRAVHRAVRHLDFGFLWQLLREIPEGEAVAGHADQTAADVTQLSAMIDDAFGHENPDVADALRPIYLDYLEKHGGRAAGRPGGRPGAVRPGRIRTRARRVAQRRCGQPGWDPAAG